MSRLLLAAVLVLLPVTLSAANRPNVLVILTDDQGWGDLSLNGNRNLSTPHIDSLARDGARFQRFYVCPVCSVYSTKPRDDMYMSKFDFPRGLVCPKFP